jgi:hypothetical protein
VAVVAVQSIKERTLGKKFKFESSFQTVCDAREPGKFFFIGVLHHMPDPISDLGSDVYLAHRTPGRLDWEPVFSGSDLFDYSSWFTCIALDPAGTIYIGQEDGFVRHRDGKSEVIELRKSINLETSLECAYARGIDDIVFGSYAGHIVSVQGKNVTVQKIGQSRLEHVTACLNRIHGIGPDFMVTVGDGGNIGCYRSGKWEKVRSPSNVRLTGVWCKSVTEIYITGWNAHAWRWDGADRWEPLECDYTPEDVGLYLTDVVEFQGQIYAAGGDYGVFRLQDDRFIQVPKVKDEYVGRLAVTNIGLVGTGDVWGESGSWITLFDGNEWKAVQMKLVRQN